jgi:hypothetical protein
MADRRIIIKNELQLVETELDKVAEDAETLMLDIKKMWDETIISDEASDLYHQYYDQDVRKALINVIDALEILKKYKPQIHEMVDTAWDWDK